MIWPFTRAPKQATKASVFASMLMVTPGTAAWPERDIKQLALEAYRKNVVAYRCISMIASEAAALPIDAYARTTGGDVEAENHPLLALLRRPNPLQTGQDLIEAAISWMLISGSTYIERVTGLGKVPQELYVLPSDRVKVIPGANGWPVAYEYTVNGQVRREPVGSDMANLPIFQVKTFNPLNDYYGQSPIDPAAFAIDTHNSAGGFNKALLDNSATPSGALSVRPDKEGNASLTKDQRETLTEALEKRFQGKQNSGRPMILEGGLEWQSFSYSLKDLQFVEMKQEAAREIALAFGVPPMLLGIPGDNTYSNYAEANRAFYRSTVIPVARKLLAALSMWLAPSYGPNDVFLRVDEDGVLALSSEREEMWRRVEGSNFLTVNEQREAVGYSPIEGGDVVLRPANEIPLESAIDPISGGASDATNDPISSNA